MKGSVYFVALVLALVFLPTVLSSRHISRTRTHHGRHHSASGRVRTRDGPIAANSKVSFYRERRPTTGTTRRQGTDTVQIAGSNLPDCSHACGSCAPCRLVMVSFVCASLEEAETCPMAYRCMCNNKSFPVP